jgi:copper resistance protein B
VRALAAPLLALAAAGGFTLAAYAQPPPAHDHAVMEHARTFSFLRADVDAGVGDEAEVFTWDIDGWRGGDRNKLWLKSEGETPDGELETAEVQLLYSRNVSTFFDAQIGVRHDFEPDGLTYLVLGLQGLAPYQFETDAALFLSERGDLSFRYEQSLDLLLTQRLVVEPEIELEAFAGDVPERQVGAGLSELEASLRLRYEITRKFAPYAEVAYHRLLGETSSLARRRGESPEETTLRAGLRVWF